MQHAVPLLTSAFKSLHIDAQMSQIVRLSKLSNRLCLPHLRPCQLSAAP
jgi:hypothetical protein